MTNGNLPGEARRRIRTSVKRSCLSHVARDKEQLLLCPWEKPDSEHVRDKINELRESDTDLNAYDFDALDHYRTTLAPNKTEQEITTRTARCSDAVFVISDGCTSIPPCQQTQNVFDAMAEDGTIPHPAKERLYLMLISDEPTEEIRSRHRPSGIGESITVSPGEVVERIRSEYGRLTHNSNFRGTPGDYWYND